MDYNLSPDLLNEPTFFLKLLNEGNLLLYLQSSRFSSRRAAFLLSLTLPEL